MSRPEITWLTEKELRERVMEILAEYPWFEDYPANYHDRCVGRDTAREDIAREYGHAAGVAWGEYQIWLYLLGEDR